MVKSIINIGKTCKNQGIKYILISSILVKQSIKLGKIIVQVNEFLLSLSKENGFYFVPHQGITRKHISHDSVHLSSDGSHMFANNLFDFINYFIFDSNAVNIVDWNKAVCNESLDPKSNSSNQEYNSKINSDLDLDELLKVEETYPNNPLIGCINIDSISNKFSGLCEILKKALINILCIDETKLDCSFPDAQFKIDGYQFPLFKKDRNAKGGSKIVFIRHVLVVKRFKIFETKTAEKICIELTIFKRKWCISFI